MIFVRLPVTVLKGFTFAATLVTVKSAPAHRTRHRSV
jgi:hypothetical protein